jgi:hypothetical protein
MCIIVHIQRQGLEYEVCLVLEVVRIFSILQLSTELLYVSISCLKASSQPFGAVNFVCEL